MPDFFNPFSGTVPDRKLTHDELLRALRLDIAGELEAIHGYMAHADATDNALAKAVLTDIANEERVHAGELIRLLGILTDGEEDGFLRQGTLEVDTLAAKLAAPAPATAAVKDEPTIGSLRTTGA
ncbi:ferritin family protein [Methanoregula sp.]|uniref:ferritin family protein n=1 Tax=Methanoregula sp. TaxID=2052170 RepID=UPI003BB11114